MVLPFSLSFDFCVSCCWRCFVWQNFETIATFWSGIVIQYKITDTSIYQIILSTRFPSVPVYYLRYKGIFLRKQITVVQLFFFFYPNWVHWAVNHSEEQFQKMEVSDSLISCKRKTDSCKNICGFKNIRILVDVAQVWLTSNFIIYLTSPRLLPLLNTVVFSCEVGRR